MQGQKRMEQVLRLQKKIEHWIEHNKENFDYPAVDLEFLS